MEIKNQDYAKVLFESLAVKDAKTIAKNFWYFLNENGDYQKLRQILKTLDEEFAKKEGEVFVEIRSAEKLTPEQTDKIKVKLYKKLGKKVFLRESVSKKSLAGLKILVQGREIDLSLGGKIERLKKVLIK